jgi:hypothetical protein
LANAAVGSAIVLLIVCGMLAPVIGYTKLFSFFAGKPQPATSSNDSYHLVGPHDTVPNTVSKAASPVQNPTVSEADARRAIEAANASRPNQTEFTTSGPSLQQQRTGPTTSPRGDDPPILTRPPDRYRH